VRLVPHVGRVIEYCFLLGYNPASLGNQFLALRGNVGISSSRVGIDGYFDLWIQGHYVVSQHLEAITQWLVFVSQKYKCQARASRRPASRIGVSSVRLCTLSLHNFANRRRFSYTREGYVTLLQELELILQFRFPGKLSKCFADLCKLAPVFATCFASKHRLFVPWLLRVKTLWCI
jgi:hypothetical protein